MKINNNIQALNAYRNLYQNQNQTSKNLEKLSSGLRINRAADDAAGLAISEKMRSQIRGLKMAERNAMDGISLMQTSEGAMQEVHSMLQRMRELAVQGANDTNTDEDRVQIQKEIDQLLTEIDSVADKTEFNTRKLLNGESAVLTTYNQGRNEANIQGDPTVINPSLQSGNYGLSVEDVEIVREVTQPAAGIGRDDEIEFANPENGDLLGTYTINIRNFSEAADGTRSATLEVIGPDGLPKDEKVAVQVGAGVEPDTVTVGPLSIPLENIERSGTVQVRLEAKANFAVWQSDNKEDDESFRVLDFNREITTVNGKINHGGIDFDFISNISNSIPLEGERMEAAKAVLTALDDNDAQAYLNGASPTIFEDDPNFENNDFVDAIIASLDGVDDLAQLNALSEEEKAVINKSFDAIVEATIPFRDGEEIGGTIDAGDQAAALNAAKTAASALLGSEFSVINNSLAFQIGPNTNQNVMIDVPELNVVELGIDDISVTTQQNANDAIFSIDGAIQEVSSIRAKLGAVQNRMEHTINNLQVTHENLTSSESRIRDADMALEMTEFTRNNILNQSATAMLAQANQLPQGVLQLLQ